MLKTENILFGGGGVVVALVSLVEPHFFMLQVYLENFQNSMWNEKIMLLSFNS